MTETGKFLNAVGKLNVRLHLIKCHGMSVRVTW